MVCVAHAELEMPQGPVRKTTPEVQLANPNVKNRVHRVGNIWMNMTNFGFFGNYSRQNTNQMTDPEFPGTYAPQAMYPANSGQEYLYMGAIWVGAMVQQGEHEFPRVSVGSEGWVRTSSNTSIIEFWPGEGSSGGIIERSTRPNDYNRLGDYISNDSAVSEQDFIATYTDTLRDPFWVGSDPIDGAHYPLGIKVTQKSYAFSYSYAKDFIFLDYEVENIATNYLKNLYVGLYVDGDVGGATEQVGVYQTDDICGFQRYYYYNHPDGTPDSTIINVAYIADGDGRPVNVCSGSDFTVPNVLGSRVLRSPNPRLKTSFNWWVSNGNTDLDFGPSWTDSKDWTETYGTPMGDAHKYDILSNREFDYDQVYTNNLNYISSHPQQDLDQSTIFHQWRTPKSGIRDQIAKGFDTRYLLSWGPLGVYDHTEAGGNRVYRLNPGEKFQMTIAFVAGMGFHDPNRQQLSCTSLDPTLYNFGAIRTPAQWAARVYDNPMRDTHTKLYPYGDGWYGKDTGTDGLFAAATGDSVIIDGVFHDFYPGPDPDGTENNGHNDSLNQHDSRFPEFLGHMEDSHPWIPPRLSYMSGNGMVDDGDGDPDFLGPPPPPIPKLRIESHDQTVTLIWTPMPSEDPNYFNPFSHLSDFEGYRVYVSESGLEQDFSLVSSFDKVDYAYFDPHTDSLATVPDSRTNAPSDTSISGVHLVRRPVGPNTGFGTIWHAEDSTYRCIINGVPPLIPRYYSVTCYSYGDPKTGTQSLETGKLSDMVYTAPSMNTLSKKVGVVPNPYRVDRDYTAKHGNGLSWENRDDGTPDFYPQQDRRIYFYNLPKKALIRIFTVAGDLVVMIPHNIEGSNHIGATYDFAEYWNLQNRNEQMVSSGLYLFSVEDKTNGNSGSVSTGKFVIIR